MAGGTVIGVARRSRLALAALAAALLTVAAALVLMTAPRAIGGTSTLQLVTVGTFDTPVHVDNAPGYPNLLFVVEQDGVVRVVRKGETLSEPFLDISKRVARTGTEEGLLSIAFHPDYERNRRFYVFYVNTQPGHDLQVDQFKHRRDSAVRTRARSREMILIVPHDQANNHNGGQLQFGPDGHLYVGTGDGGPQRDPEDDAQSPDSLLGKILRISPSKDGAYDVPKSNPFVGGPGRDEIFATGLRNPYRFSFDAETGDLTIGDVGFAAFEEVNYEPAAQALGANFGWNDYEGFQQTTFGTAPLADPHEPPIHAYSDAPGPCEAITGGYVVRDPDLPTLEGRYIYADYCGGPLRSLVPAEDGASDDASVGLSPAHVSSFGEGVGRQLYVVSRDGPLYALEPST